MTITKKQALAMGLILAAGLLAGAGVLHGDRSSAASEGKQAAEAEHDHAGHGKPESSDAGASGAAGHDEHAHDQAHDHPHGAHERASHDADEERLVRLTEAQIRKAGIALQAAGPGQVQATTDFPGEVRFNDDRTAHVVPRLAGVAEMVAVSQGQQVRKGQVLAVIASTTLSDQRSELLTAQRRREAAQVSYEREKKLWQDRISAEQDYLAAQTALHEAEIAVQNATAKLAAVGASSSPTNAATGLNRFEIRAPFDGTVVEKHLSLGEAVKEDTNIFTLSDLRTVWAEFNVAPRDLAGVRVGQRVTVSSSAFQGQPGSEAKGVISYVGALLGEQTRTARARVTLANPDGAWRPGLFVTVSVYGERKELALTLPADALQSIENQPMVFRAVTGGFEAVPVKVGRSDGRTVEILSGLTPGEQVAARNTFVLRSELGKAGAAHEH